LLDNAEKAVGFMGSMELDQFFKDEKTSYAVVRALEIIGEAARKIPEDVRADIPELQWPNWAPTHLCAANGRYGGELRRK
jgi:uncharacterized protein with HEPN domain